MIECLLNWTFLKFGMFYSLPFIWFFNMILDYLLNFWFRFSYPVSLPEDIGSALGVTVPPYLKFYDFLAFLSAPSCRPTKLCRFMPRDAAEKVFKDSAVYTEIFANSTVCSYCFKDGWVEIVLHFDRDSRLRRIYVQHSSISDDDGIELPLKTRLV